MSYLSSKVKHSAVIRFLFLREGVERYGDIFYAMIGVKRTLVISNPTSVRYVLQDEEKFGLSGADRIFKSILGSSQGTSHGKTWNIHNKLSRPHFTAKVIDKYLNQNYVIFEEALNKFHANVAESVDMTLVIKKSIIQSTLQFLGHNPTTQQIELIILIYDDFLENILSKVRNPFSKEVRESSIDHLEETIPSFNELIQSIIENKSHPLIKKYLKSEDASLTNLRDQLAGIIVTGYGSVVYGLDSSLVFISKNPKIAKEIQAELDEKFHHPSDIFKLKYLEAVLLESMRLMPPAWMVYRRVNEDVIIEGYSIPKGTEILVNIYGMNHNTSFWESPDDFVPSRFLEAKQEDLRNVYMPFGSGRRVCLGANLAMQEMLMFLAIFMKNYDVESVGNILEALPKLSVVFSQHQLLINTRKK